MRGFTGAQASLNKPGVANRWMGIYPAFLLSLGINITGWRGEKQVFDANTVGGWPGRAGRTRPYAPFFKGE
ncbi:MAG: hypothetical protein WC708_13270 [Lentisphaeria bacterium]